MFSKLLSSLVSSMSWALFSSGRLGMVLASLVLVGIPAVVEAQPTGNGLVLWLKAGEGVAASAEGFVTDWADASGNLNDAAQHEADLSPLLVVNAVNGQSVLRFDGTDDYLEIANAPILQAGSGDWTVFFVAKRL